MEYKLEKLVGNQKLSFEVGKLAGQASGAVLVRYGDTAVLVTVVMASQPRSDIDFLPLTVEFEEKLYAIGKVPGSFFRREGRPSSEAILSARLIDRPLRPQFPKELHNSIQIVATVLSSDRENPPDILGIIGASAAVSISEIPFNGPVGATRIAVKDGNYIINPTFKEIEESQLNVAVAGGRGAIGMVEAGSDEVAEAVVLEAIKKAQDANDEIIDMIQEMVEEVGKPKLEFAPTSDGDQIVASIEDKIKSRLTQAMELSSDNPEKAETLQGLENEMIESLSGDYDSKLVSDSFHSLQKRLIRLRILSDGIRPDGRGLTDIRKVSSEVGLLPRAHGTGLFNRGQTQVLSVTTLASLGMKQSLDTLNPEEKKRFMHHYNFPPFSVGETGRMFTGRREIGHGALAERAIIPALPNEEEFPYAIRVVSEVLSSNGSTSMASVCGASLSLMDAGVPIKSPVAGVAMGLIMGDDGNYAVLTDIQGMEDFLGDMDFKVAGTGKGINALQMDSKIKGLTYEILEIALEQARVGRLYILDKMSETIRAARETLSPFAPKMLRIMIPVEKIGMVIGPGGRNIRAIIEETGATVDIDDKGVVMLGANEDEKLEAARQWIEGMTRDLVVGDILTGKVSRLTSFGSFVQLLGGKEGLLRNEEKASIDGEFDMGQELTIVVHEIDSMGRLNLSRRSLFGEESPPKRQFDSRRSNGPRDGGFRRDRQGPNRGRYR